MYPDINFFPFPGWTGSQESKNEGNLDWQPVQIIRTKKKKKKNNQDLSVDPGWRQASKIRMKKSVFLTTWTYSTFMLQQKALRGFPVIILHSVRSLSPSDLIYRDRFFSVFCIYVFCSIFCSFDVNFFICVEEALWIDQCLCFSSF